MNRYQYLLLGVVGGLALGFIIGRHYGMRMQDQTDRATYEVRDKVDVLAAGKDLPAGATLVRDDLRKMAVPTESVGDHVLREDVDRIVGRTTRAPIERGQPLRWADIQASTGGASVKEGGGK